MSNAADVSQGRSDRTIDLRFPEAQWTYRQLQARVSQAHDRLAQAEADAAARAEVATAAGNESAVNESLLAAQELIAREWTEMAQVSAARLAETDIEVLRIRETAEAEARALEDEAGFLRSPSSERVTSGSGARVDGSSSAPEREDGQTS